MRARTALRCFSQARRPIRAELGQIERYDCECRRISTANPSGVESRSLTRRTFVNASVATIDMWSF
jgi:hypothetical protein